MHLQLRLKGVSANRVRCLAQRAAPPRSFPRSGILPVLPSWLGNPMPQRLISPSDSKRLAHWVKRTALKCVIIHTSWEAFQTPLFPGLYLTWLWIFLLVWKHPSVCVRMKRILYFFPSRACSPSCSILSGSQIMLYCHYLRTSPNNDLPKGGSCALLIPIHSAANSIRS